MTTITSREQLDALPVGTIVNAHWDNYLQPDHRAVRVPAGRNAVPGWSLFGPLGWSEMWTWGATLTIVSEPEPTTAEPAHDALEAAARIWKREVRPAAATLAISEMRDRHDVPELGKELWGRPDLPTPLTNVVLRVIEPVVTEALARALHAPAPAAGTPDDVPASEVIQAARRLTPLLTEDGDWLFDPESIQFQNDIKTVIRAVGVEPVEHSYGDDDS